MSTAHDGPKDREQEHPHRSAASASDKPERPSLLQTLAGALTAITVTYLMSFLGVAGTIIGVGLVSVLTVVGNFMYSSAIHTAKEKVKQAQPKPRKRGLRSGTAGASVSADHPKEFSAVTDPEATDHDDMSVGSPWSASTENEAGVDEPNGGGEPVSTHLAGPEEASAGRWRRTWTTMIDRYGRGKIVGSIVLVFVLLAGTVTVIELSVGQPLSDIVRNEDSSGTSFFGGRDGDEVDTGIDDDDTGELPPPQDEGGLDEPPAPEAPEHEDQGPGEEPEQQDQPAPEEGQPAPEVGAPEQ